MLYKNGVIHTMAGTVLQHGYFREKDGLIEEVGRLDAPGRPILFGTTEDFLRSFGISSVEELPKASPEQIEDFKEEAEEELGQKGAGQKEMGQAPEKDYEEA